MFSQHLIIRADASTETGTGHVMRCIAIAQAWQDAGGEATFASKELPESLLNRIQTEGFSACPIEAAAGSKADASQLLNIASALDATAIVLDGYTYDVEYHNTIADTRFTSLAIDDNSHLKSYSTDFVLNQNAGVTTSSYPSRSPQTELLLGTSYALLRREFLTATGKAENKTSSVRILVTLGGSDPDNVTATVVEGLQSHATREIEVRLIMGSINPHVETIVGRTASDKRFEILQNVADMSEQYCWADVVITAGGSSNWEMCYFGLPRIVIIIADNQTEIAQQIEDLGIGMNLGRASKLSPSVVWDCTQRLVADSVRLKNARSVATKLVDGRGAIRCVRTLLDARRAAT